MNQSKDEDISAEALIQPFCADDKERLRPWMCEPFRFGEHAYATNGHLCVRVKDPFSAIENQEIASRIDGFIERARARNAELTGVPELPPRNVQKCYECVRGIIPECSECGTENVKCPWCDGLGEIEIPVRVKIGASEINRKYAALIGGLPDARIARQDTVAEPVLFTFSSGEGVVMPLVPVTGI